MTIVYRVRLGDEQTGRIELERPMMTVGSAFANLLVLPDHGVAPEHCQIAVDARGRYQVTAAVPIAVDDRDVEAGTVEARHGAHVAIGDYTLIVGKLPPPGAVEAGLLAAIDAGEAASRAIYADWLEQHGRLGHARFQRIQDELAALAPDDARRAPLIAEGRELCTRDRSIDLRGWQPIGEPRRARRYR